MPTLEGFDGRSLVPNITGTLRGVGQGLMGVRALGRDMQADQLAEQANAGDVDALAMLGRFDPQAAQHISGILEAKDAQAAAQARGLVENRARLMAGYLQAAEQGENMAMNYLVNEAQRRQQAGEPIDDLVQFSQLPGDRRNLMAQRDLLQAQTIEEILKKQFPDPAKETSLIQNLRAAGIDPASPEGQELIRASITKPATQVNVGSQAPGGGFGADQGKFAEVLATKQAEQWSKQTDLANSSDENIALAQEMVSLLDSGLKTGAIAPLRAGVDKFTQSAFGVSLTGIDPAQAERFEAISNRLANQLRTPGEGVMTDKDFEVYKASTANLGASPEANAIALEAFRKVQERNKEKAVEMESWISKTGSLTGFTEYWNRYMKQKPLFGEAAGAGGGGATLDPDTEALLKQLGL